MSGGGSKLAHLDCDGFHKFEDIPDLLVKIFLYLPVKSVVSCQHVCKLWSRLIKDPKFAQLHFKSSPRVLKFILYVSLVDSDPDSSNELSLMGTDGEVSRYVTLPPSLNKDFSLQLICSFNGLTFFTKLVGDSDLAILICNLAIGEVLEVPGGSPSAVTPSIAILSEPNRDKYAIFRFFSDAFESEETSYKYEIYAPDDGEWGRVSEVEQCPVTNPACPYFPTHVCTGGRIYWLVWSKENTEVPDYILSVDVDGNISKLKLPETDRMEYNLFTFLVNYQGCLALVCVCDDESCLFVWSLMDHNSSSWLFHGGTELWTDSYIDSINSIVSLGQELLFIINPGSATSTCFKFLNAEEMTWREINCLMPTAKGEPVAFLYEESLFQCKCPIDSLTEKDCHLNLSCYYTFINEN